MPDMGGPLRAPDLFELLDLAVPQIDHEVLGTVFSVRFSEEVGGRGVEATVTVAGVCSGHEIGELVEIQRGRRRLSAAVHRGSGYLVDYVHTECAGDGTRQGITDWRVVLRPVNDPAECLFIRTLGSYANTHVRRERTGGNSVVGPQKSAIIEVHGDRHLERV